MWSYDGWADLSRVSGEVRDPARTLPRALILGTLAILVIYLLANLGYARTLGFDGLRRSTVGEHMPVAHLATLTLETSAGWSLLGTLIFVSCIGACMTNLLTAPRVFVPLAADGLFIAALGRVSERHAVPARAIGVALRHPPERGDEQTVRRQSTNTGRSRQQVGHARADTRHEDERAQQRPADVSQGERGQMPPACVHPRRSAAGRRGQGGR